MLPAFQGFGLKESSEAIGSSRPVLTTASVLKLLLGAEGGESNSLPLWRREDLTEQQLIVEYQREARKVRKAVTGNIVKVRHLASCSEPRLCWCHLSCQGSPDWGKVDVRGTPWLSVLSQKDSKAIEERESETGGASKANSVMRHCLLADHS